MRPLIRIPEPPLLFGHRQALEDPRDGLSLFGPLDEGKPYGVRAAIIGHRAGIRRLLAWIDRMAGVIRNATPARKRPPFPGFAAAFGIPWTADPLIRIEVDEEEIQKCASIGDRYQRVYRTVALYSSRILDALRQEEQKPDLWLVVIPEIVYRNCRPLSRIAKEDRTPTPEPLDPREAKKAERSPYLFAEFNRAAIPYQYDPDFHNQLKARLLPERVLTQIVRETTIAHRDFRKANGKVTRNLEIMEPDIAWNLSSAVFYKAGGRPWKLGTVRQGVCYVGLVFKKIDDPADPQSACCAAQMFLDSGDGVVFKGDVGPWYIEGRGEFHLKRRAAENLIGIAIESYRARNQGRPPKELFIHGRTWFNDEEWAGFREAAGDDTQIVGVRIRSTTDLKLYRKADQPVLRGLAFVEDARRAYVWTKGYVPRLQTYPGRETPNPLLIDICRGNADIVTVLTDIMGLTKLNYNSCRYADGVPVTLRFADAVGEILTCGPRGDKPPPLRFAHYI